MVTTSTDDALDISSEASVVISKQRVTDHGEVLTGTREVNAMLDLVKQETERIESRLLGVSLSAALAELHRAGLIHRDIKPSNIIFLSGVAKLADIGLVNRIAPRDARLPAELIDLSPAYTAPLTEQWYPGPQDNTLASLPQGEQKLAGIHFDVRGLVQLSGGEIARYAADPYPGRVGASRWNAGCSDCTSCTGRSRK